MHDTLLHRVKELAQSRKDKTAVVFKKESLTYPELFSKALSVAARLKEMGVRPGDRVCFSAVSKPEMVAVYLAVHACRAVAVFLDKGATPEHMAEIYTASGAVILLTDKPMKEAGEGINVFSLKEVYGSGTAPLETDIELPPEDELADILFTTGTTGKPKGVMLSYKAVYHILKNTVEGCGYSENTVILLPLPLNHSFALRVLRAVLYAGGTVVLQNGFTFAQEAEKNILEHNCNSIAVVPASYEMMKNQMQDKFLPVMSHIESFEAGAGSLSAGQRYDLVKTLPDARIMNVWGSSESGGAIFCDVQETVKSEETAGALGKAKAGVEVMFLSQDAPFSEPEKIRGRIRDFSISADRENPGRMAIKGDMIMSGYWGDPQKTAESLIDGWLITGDLAYEDKGNIFMLGRADDLINYGGEKVSPIEVENAVSRYDSIVDCGCIGVDDEFSGQIPVLFVVTGIGFDNTAFQKWMAERIEKTKMPKKTLVVEEIPRNRMKKIDRKGLRRMWEDRESLSLRNPVIDAILSRRSIRHFTDKEIPKEMLDIILKCGYHAPNGQNLQSWKFTVLTKSIDIEKLKETAAETAAKNNVKMYGFENPAAMILISNDIRNPHSCQDASCAAENIMLSARSLGLGSTWINVLMDLRDKEPVKSLLDGYGIPEHHRVWASIALGWPLAEGVKTGKRPDVVKYL